MLDEGDAEAAPTVNKGPLATQLHGLVVAAANEHDLSILLS